jgi:hypothetical protein
MAKETAFAAALENCCCSPSGDDSQPANQAKRQKTTTRPRGEQKLPSMTLTADLKLRNCTLTRTVERAKGWRRGFQAATALFIAVKFG